MKFLFTAPRFHTNQVPIVKGLIEKGHEVRYFVVFVGATEDHTYCEPLVLKPSKTTIREKKKLAKTRTASEIESIIGGHFIPDIQFLNKAFEDYDPDVVICREETNLTIFVNALCDMYSIPCVLYDQKPLYRLITNEKQVKTNTCPKNSLLKRVVLKIERNFNTEKRSLMRIRDKTGFPTVHMTPVKYSLLPRELSSIKPEKDGYYIPFVIDTNSEAKNRIYLRDGVVNILCVGKYRQYKKLDLLVNAVSTLGNSIDWSLTIIGQAKSQDERDYFAGIDRIVKEKKLEDKVTLLKEVPYECIGEIYSKHDLFVLPSRREYANISVLEAMSYGLAVISTDYNGTASYVEESNGGAIFETGNAEVLANKISEICESNIRLLGNNSRQYVSERLSFERYYSALGNMLKKEFGIVLE